MDFTHHIKIIDMVKLSVQRHCIYLTLMKGVSTPQHFVTVLQILFKMMPFFVFVASEINIKYVVDRIFISVVIVLGAQCHSVFDVIDPFLKISTRYYICFTFFYTEKR